ncbi:MAG: MBL fold metallo-hydrolase [Bacteroidota bacterium]
MLHIIDLHFQTEQTIASFVVETSAGPVVIETGPHSTFHHLEEGLHKLGYQVSDVKHVFLTHIHFDHAGAAWAFAKEGATVYVHPVGYKHMLDPTRLYNSAKRIYGDQMEPLWGLMEKIPEELLISVEDKQEFQVGDQKFTAHFTPGHANHHIAWQWGGTIFTGDVAGVKIGEGPVVAPCPPPDINLEKWQVSIQLLRSLNPQYLYLTHFGKITEIGPHLDQLESGLQDWANWIKPHYEAGRKPEEVVSEFEAYAAEGLRAAGLDDHGLKMYEAANPAYMSVAGLMRYWHKKKEAEQSV